MGPTDTGLFWKWRGRGTWRTDSCWSGACRSRGSAPQANLGDPAGCVGLHAVVEIVYKSVLVARIDTVDFGEVLANTANTE